MTHCLYHPVEPSTFHCYECDTEFCESCVDFRNDLHICFDCGTPLRNLGATNQLKPFWRRLPESFKYPLNIHSLIAIIGSSILILILSLAPSILTLIFIVLVTFAITMYCFTCLTHTAAGHFTPPDLSQSLEGGLRLLFSIIFVFFIYGLVGYLVATTAGLLALIAAIAIMCIISPATFMIYALTNNVFTALNPLKTLKIIRNIGLPYGILLVLFAFMTGSIEVINQIIGDPTSRLNLLLQLTVSNFYTIVMFHMMGYIIYQNKERLGFSNSEDHYDARTDDQILFNQISIMIKKGQYEKAIEQFRLGLNQYPDSKELNKGYFNFLIASKNNTRLEKFAPYFFKHLTISGHQNQIYPYYNQLLSLVPNYQPKTAATRYNIAQSAFREMDYQKVAKVLMGMHQHFPDFPELADAYELLALSLDNLPNMSQKAEQCRLLVKKLPPKATETPKPQVQQQTIGYTQSQSPIAKGKTETNSQKAVKELPAIEFN